MELARKFDLDQSLIIPTRMSDLPWVAKRPIDSSLNTAKARRKLMNKPLHLDDALRTLKAEILGADISSDEISESQKLLDLRL